MRDFFSKFILYNTVLQEKVMQRMGNSSDKAVTPYLSCILGHFSPERISVLEKFIKLDKMLDELVGFKIVV